MAHHRSKIGRPLKRRLFREAGGKCANPGCSNWRTHIHHIREWAVYETHDAAHMIAVCPACHDAIHDGPLAIDDETIYGWKGINRGVARRAHVYVEPDKKTLLLLGSVAATGDAGVTVFDLGDNNSLGFRVVDGDVLLLHLRVTDVAGQEVLRIVDGHVRFGPPAGFHYSHQPGMVAVHVDDWAIACPVWITDAMRREVPDFAGSDDYPFFELRVVRPGVVRVRGVWVRGGYAVVITDDRLSFLSPSQVRPLNVMGEGVDSVLHFTGPITDALFGFTGARQATAPVT